MMKRLLLKISTVALLLLLILTLALGTGCGGPTILNIAFTTSPQVLDAGLASKVITIQIQDAKGKISNLKTDTVINLISTSLTGRFDTSPTGSFNGNITSVNIPKGSASASFYYKDIVEGSPTVTATESPSQGWNQGIQSYKVNPELKITTSALPNGNASTSYSQNLGSAGGTGTSTWSVSSSSLPAGLTLSGNTISGTPTTAGLANFTVKVGDGIDAVTKEISININPALAVSTNSLPKGDPNISYTHTLLASGGSGNYNWSIIDGNLPAGLSLDSSTGVISGIPTTPNNASFTVRVSDGIGVATKTLTTIVNSPRSIVTALLPNGTQNGSYSQSLDAAGGSGNYTWSINGGALPTGLSLTGNTISGTPTASGEFSFTVQVSDGIGSVA
jgi:large repetitive protein